MGLWLLLAWMVPVLVTGLPDVIGLAIGLLVLGGGLAAFVFSLWGLHRQIVEVKENQLELARELYAEAYAPVRAERTLEALERQHSLLGAADALEKRARAIHDLARRRRDVGMGDWDCDERCHNHVRAIDPPPLGVLNPTRPPAPDRRRGPTNRESLKIALTDEATRQTPPPRAERSDALGPCCLGS
jgi:hypothetical protein